jgi:hypothetical protein
MDMSGQKISSGTWVVLALLAMGIIAALAGLKFRQMPRDDVPATTRSVVK